jgi:hypothetical protein
MGWKARPQEALETSRTNFINVDLDLKGSFDLAPLLAALGPVHIIHTPDESASFYILELDAVGLDFEATLGGFLDLIEQLDGAACHLCQSGIARLNNSSVTTLSIHIDMVNLMIPSCRKIELGPVVL